MTCYQYNIVTNIVILCSRQVSRKTCSGEKHHCSLWIISFANLMISGVKPCEGPTSSSIRVPPPRHQEEAKHDNFIQFLLIPSWNHYDLCFAVLALFSWFRSASRATSNGKRTTVDFWKSFRSGLISCMLVEALWQTVFILHKIFKTKFAKWIEFVTGAKAVEQHHARGKAKSEEENRGQQFHSNTACRYKQIYLHSSFIWFIM